MVLFTLSTLPRVIEWWVGAGLLGAFAMLLGMAAILAQVRTDVRLELTGTLEGVDQQWVFSAAAAETRLPLLRQCRLVQLEKSPVIAGRVIRIAGQWEAGENNMQARIWISLEDPLPPALADSLRPQVRATFIGEEGASLLKVLAETAFTRSRR